VTEIANTDEYEAWNGDTGHRWVVDADRRDHVLAPVADALLAAAHLTLGEPVVDIGCGCGATTLAAARAVGSTGSAYGIDLSGPMLGVARRRAEASGLSSVTLIQGDVQIHRFPARFDAAISRFGTMFFADQTAALANIRRGLRPRGRLCLATWQPLVANDGSPSRARRCCATAASPAPRPADGACSPSPTPKASPPRCTRPGTRIRSSSRSS
jgi:SAM-dependent methyltransferase